MNRWFRRPMEITAVALALACAAGATPPSELNDPRYLSERAVEWLEQLEAAHRPRSRPLTEEERHAFADYFAPALLDRVRVATVPRLENPEFYDEFSKAGLPPPIDFRPMSGLTLVETVLVTTESPSLRLLFHELVHIAQNQVLGFERATELYVESWFEGNGYRRIAHEEQAYALTERFTERGTPFSVEREVGRRFAKFRPSE